MDEDGYLWFVSRADDVIISSGFVEFWSFVKAHIILKRPQSVAMVFQEAEQGGVKKGQLHEL